MNDRSTSKGRQLQTLERWRNLELEEAQTHHAAQLQIEDKRRAELTELETAMSATAEFARSELLQGKSLSPDALCMVARYAAVQRDQLESAQEELQKSQAQTTEAHAQVIERCEQLFGIERLRERRSSHEALETGRREQRQLDDLALLRVSINSVGETK